MSHFNPEFKQRFVDNPDSSLISSEDYMNLYQGILNTGDPIAADVLFSAGVKTILLAGITAVETEEFGHPILDLFNGLAFMYRSAK